MFTNLGMLRKVGNAFEYTASLDGKLAILSSSW